MSIRFEDLGLSRELLASVRDMGFEETSPIQEGAIPSVLAGRDLIGQAQTGTGKTAAFGIPLLQRLDLTARGVQALILCPTRELAVQVAEELGRLAAHMPRISIVPIYGGQAIGLQLRALERGAQIVVGTPGRVMDHMERRTLRLDTVRMAVLDEADEMLNMGFRDAIEAILQTTAPDCQKVFFSATMPPAIQKLAERFLRNPEIIKITQKVLTVTNIEQVSFEVRPHQKMEGLCRLLDSNDFRKVLVFCSTKRGVDDMTAALQSNGYPVDGLHGNLSQVQRDRVMARFRSGIITILTATDVAARGLDVDDVDAVINYDVPNDTSTYVHRIGRTGRAGRTGKAYTFAAAGEIWKLRAIMRYTKAKIEPALLPTARDVAVFQTRRILDDIDSTIEGGGLERYDTLLKPLFEKSHNSRDVAAAVMRLLMQRTFGKTDLPALLDAPAPVTPPPAPSWKKEREAAPQSVEKADGMKPHGMVWLAFDIGRKAGLTPKDLVAAIVTEANVQARLIGTIEIHENFTMLDVAEDIADDIMDTMNGCQILGARVSVKHVQPPPSYKKPVKSTGPKRKAKPGKVKKRLKK